MYESVQRWNSFPHCSILVDLGVRTLFAGSKCHDLVALDSSGSLISGHFDKKIRFWDARNDSARCEIQLQAAITSLSINRGATRHSFHAT